MSTNCLASYELVKELVSVSRVSRPSARNLLEVYEAPSDLLARPNCNNSTVGRGGPRAPRRTGSPRRRIRRGNRRGRRSRRPPVPSNFLCFVSSNIFENFLKLSLTFSNFLGTFWRLWKLSEPSGNEPRGTPGGPPGNPRKQCFL